MAQRTPVPTLAQKEMRRLTGPVCIALGLLLILASFGGSWGSAYGQTVVTPTPELRFGDPVVSKTGSPACCEPGDPVSYTITVTNVGTANATNVVVEDTLPPELTLLAVVPSKGLLTVNGNYFRVEIGTVAPGEVVTIAVQATVGEGSPVDIVVTNVAHLTSDQGPRDASFPVNIKAKGQCATPPILPPTGQPLEKPEAAFSLWVLAAGLLVLLFGVLLTVRARGHVRVDES
jgi:uncharacterized repeat protein (TIGR01451 family)